MKKFTIESHRHLLIVLFFIFEALLVASDFVIYLDVGRRNMQIRAAVGITLLFSLVGQVIVCFLLRRTAQRLAKVGWVTLVGSLLIGLLYPEL